ncbi:hypothetical protein P280DRAFT_446141 [Massarina eburnea CBS 473.64]|uniref:Uncharacterized protein n=1 Tax=Massarina eburnea CBS 473.64 TaxID=1395130 RepID=A0A6A6S974_9PLEO|nr:hypothetical protein P280DRAFT_446141 [Massarina eburnea CBS 473.64]
MNFIIPYHLTHHTPRDKQPDILPPPRYANYLPDELLLEILNHIPRDAENQHGLGTFCAVNRQWYDVGIATLYEAPHLWGAHFDLFVRTLCPSINTRIKKSELAGLVKSLNLSYIVHQSTKAVTARMLARTKHSLEVFIAPQASFAINCWASLSKCERLRVLDLSLISEAISFQSLNQCLRKLDGLERLVLPRCSTQFPDRTTPVDRHINWPPRLEHLTLSGSVHGKFLWEMMRQPDTFPPTLHSMSILHCPGLDYAGIKPLLENLSQTLTTVELRDLPAVKQGRFNAILNWLPHLTSLTVAIDYIDCDFGLRPTTHTSEHWSASKPLEELTLLTSSGMRDIDPDTAFTIPDLYDLLDNRFLGRMRRITVAKSCGWETEGEGAELEALAELLVDELDTENWTERRWHYADLAWGQGAEAGRSYREWIVETGVGRRMRAMLVVLQNR